jgi:hypothetical protein
VEDGNWDVEDGNWAAIREDGNWAAIREDGNWAAIREDGNWDVEDGNWDVEDGNWAAIREDGNWAAISIDSNPLLRRPSKLIASRFPTSRTLGALVARIHNARRCVGPTRASFWAIQYATRVALGPGKAQRRVHGLPARVRVDREQDVRATVSQAVPIAVRPMVCSWLRRSAR